MRQPAVVFVVVVVACTLLEHAASTPTRALVDPFVFMPDPWELQGRVLKQVKTRTDVFCLISPEQSHGFQSCMQRNEKNKNRGCTEKLFSTLYTHKDAQRGEAMFSKRNNKICALNKSCHFLETSAVGIRLIGAQLSIIWMCRYHKFMF